MDTDHVQNFLLLAQSCNMTRTAERVHLTQPALSGQIRRLEQDLQATLFHRQGRGLVLTQAGETFRRFAADALSQINAGREALGSLGTLASGAIAIGGGATSTTCILPAIIGAFHARHPGIRFAIREATSRTIATAVLSGELDLGLVTLPLPASIDAARLAVDAWVVDELVLLVPPDHPLRRRRTFRWRDLHNQPLIAFESGSAVRQLLDRQLSDHDVHPSVVMELRAIGTITNMVAAGIGLGFVSRLAAPHAHYLSCAERTLERQIAVIARRDRSRTPATEAFREALFAWKPTSSQARRANRGEQARHGMV
jgi:DNA-binding transcriptional LysR family regulator